MTYGDFRNMFNNTEEFLRAYGALDYEEAKALAEAGDSPVFVKAAMMDAWCRGRRMLQEIKK